MAFVKMFGNTLLTKAGEKPTEEVLANKTAVGVYFSAHWCPPCRGFTPQLAKMYTDVFAAKGMEIIFVSGDRDAKTFQEYYGEQPWVALPYKKRDVESELSKKFKVKGIPSLVILDASGVVITTDGRKAVSSDPTGAKYPWVPPTAAERAQAVLDTLGPDLVAKAGGKPIGLYFSAHWCPPCRGFTPVLAKFYEEYVAKDPNFEIVFVSSDKDEEGMMDYFKNDHGNYLALPFEKRKEKEELSTRFGVQGIPTFVVVKPDGKVINHNARGKVQSGAASMAAGDWAPPVVGDMAQGVEVAGTDINECPTVIAVCEGCDEAVQKQLFAELEPLAKRYIAEAEAAEEEPKYIFLVAKGGGPLDQLKSLTQKEAGNALEEAKGSVKLVLFDIPDNGGFYFSDAKEVTTATAEAFLQSKEAGKERRMQLGRA